MSKRFIATLAAALAIVVLVAGCGGGSDSSDSTAADTGGADTSDAPALSKAEFIKQGDEICAETGQKLQEGITDFSSENGLDEGEPSEEQAEELVTEVILPLIQEQAEEIDALGAPKGEEAEVEEIVAGLEEAVDEGLEDPSIATGSDNPFADVDQRSQDFGFNVCGASG
jgi:hypothetical protein